MERDQVMIFLGSECPESGGPAAYAAVMLHPRTGGRKEFSGSESEGTPRRAAVQAAILGLSKLNRPCEAWVYSGSDYLVRGYNREWSVHTHPGLWERLRELAADHDVRVRATGLEDGSVGRAEALARTKLAEIRMKTGGRAG